MQDSKSSARQNAKARFPYFSGIFLISLATLSLEILLTRVFAVTYGYSYAFLVISLGLLGIGFSTTVVFLLQNKISDENVPRVLSLSSIAFGISVFLLLYLTVNLQFSFSKEYLSSSVTAGLTGIGLLALIVMPFFFSGACVTLALSRRSSMISNLYSWDLAGAGIGCALSLVLLTMLSAESATIFVGAIGASAGVGFALAEKSRSVRLGAIGLTVLLSVLAIVNEGSDLAKISYVNAQEITDSEFSIAEVGALDYSSEPARILSDWNPVIYTEILGPYASDIPYLYGLSKTVQNVKPKYLRVRIDGWQYQCPIVKYDNQLDSIQYFQKCVDYLAFHLKDSATAFVIGSGGGLDVLALTTFNCQKIIGADFNPSLRDLLLNELKEYSGGLYTQPKIEIRTDEGRSLLARTEEPIDVLIFPQVGDWFSQAASGAILNEGILHTVEAYNQYFDKLAPGGILSITNFNLNQELIIEFRQIFTMLEALKLRGVTDVRDHLLIVRNIRVLDSDGGKGTVNMLYFRDAITPEQLAKVDSISQSLDFEIMVAPDREAKYPYDIILSPNGQETLQKRWGVLFEPVYENRPYILTFLSFEQILDRMLGKTTQNIETSDRFTRGASSVTQTSYESLTIVYMILIVVSGLAFGAILLPLLWKKRHRESLPPPWALFYFAALGVGFMLIEVPLLSMYRVFLGYPVYALSVALFSLLLFAGIGSAISARIADDQIVKALPRVIGGITLMIIVYTFAITPIFHIAFGWPTWLRIIFASLTLAPLAIPLGMALPLGLRQVSLTNSDAIPWAWGVNSFTSVAATVIAFMVVLHFGFTIALLVGAGFYAIAGGFALRLSSSR